MPTPSILGEYLKDSHSVIGIAWWCNTLLTVIAFVTSCLVVSHADDVDSSISRYQQYNNNYGDNNNNNNQEFEDYEAYMNWKEEQEQQWNPTSLTSGSVKFASLYTALLALVLAIYGIFAVKKNGLTQLGVGIFVGSLIFFAGFTFLCAIIFADVWVSGELPEEYQKEREEMGFRGNSGTYKVENSSHAFAIVCFLMSAMNIGFAFIVVQFHENLYGSQGEENKGAREMEMQQTSNQSYTLHQI